MLMNEKYDDGGAMLLLAEAYEKSDEQDKANLLYQQLLEDFKDTEVAEKAQKALDKQNGTTADQESQDSESTEE